MLRRDRHVAAVFVAVQMSLPIAGRGVVTAAVPIEEHFTQDDRRMRKGLALPDNLARFCVHSVRYAVLPAEDHAGLGGVRDPVEPRPPVRRALILQFLRPDFFSSAG